MIKKIYKLYTKYKEIILYLLFGGLTTIVSIGSYVIFLEAFHMQALIANIFSWIFAVTFAYVTNRLWVFESKNHGFHAFLKEIASFFAGRLLTLVMEELVLWVGISVFGLNSILIKLIAQVLVIVSNYIISKFFVF